MCIQTQDSFQPGAERSGSSVPQLFFVCPECFLEQAIRAEFSGPHYFLTALGCDFSGFDFEDQEAVNGLIEAHGIRDLHVVCAADCRFVQGVIGSQPWLDTDAEMAISEVMAEAIDTFARFTHAAQACDALARRHSARQAEQLADWPYLGAKIEDGSLRVRTHVYEAATQRFRQVGVLV